MPDAVESGSFYREGSPPPAPQRSFLEAAADPAWRFGLVLFAVGWAAILIQAGFFQQVVVAAPVFEEPAKVGLPIALAAWLRIRARWLRIPLAGVFGAGFGVLEHFLTYGEEDATTWAIRTAFHALSTMLSMAAFSALEPAEDARLRWASTVPSTLLHFSNNFVALVLGVSSLLVPSLDTVATGWSVFATLALALATLAVAARPAAFRDGVTALARRLVPAWRT